jgi:hypothetical protein
MLAGDASARLEQLRASREPVYSTAHLRLDTSGLDVPAAIDAIRARLQQNS